MYHMDLYSCNVFPSLFHHMLQDVDSEASVVFCVCYKRCVDYVMQKMYL